jgi:hypothetical protein
MKLAIESGSSDEIMYISTISIPISEKEKRT